MKTAKKIAIIARDEEDGFRILITGNKDRAKRIHDEVMAALIHSKDFPKPEPAEIKQLDKALYSFDVIPKNGNSETFPGTFANLRSILCECERTIA